MCKKCQSESEMMGYKVYHSLKEENNALRRFVKRNKFYSLKKIVSSLIDNMALFVKDKNENKAKHYSWLFSGLQANQEYYGYCKKIYENILDDEIIGEYAKKIYNKGGMEDLQIVFYLLIGYNPTVSIREVYTLRIKIKRIIDRAFEKHIDEWLC